MATADEIRIQAQTISGIQIESATAFLWIKEEMNDLVFSNPVAGRRVTETVTVENAGEEYTTENEIVAIDKIYSDDSRKFLDYELHNNTITFNQKGVYNIRYYTLPNVPSTVSEELDIATPYCIALKYYVASKIRARMYGQADSNAVSFYEEYNTAKTNARNYLNAKDRGHRRIPVHR